MFVNIRFMSNSNKAILFEEKLKEMLKCALRLVWIGILQLLISSGLSINAKNIVFILTDDQDLTLGGMSPLTKTKSILKNGGAEFTNMFVTTPLCCPSRASFLTGRYLFNHHVQNNSIEGNCSSQAWQNSMEKNTFITHLKQKGYNTFYAGKYLNQYGHPNVGGVGHVPPGWDEWAGLVGNSIYYNYTLSVNGQAEEHGDNSTEDYLTDVLFQKAQKFLNEQTLEKPFFIMIAPPAPHAPFTSAPKYKDRFPNVSAPRTPNFALPPTMTKHWLLRQPPHPFPKDVILQIDDIFRKRWQTLLSVDDGIGRLYETLQKMGILNNTFICFTSDNGFHLGQFSLPPEKRQLYEFDIRVPFLVSGPGIRPGTIIEEPVLNIDFAPTFLELAGISSSNLGMDGTSFFHLLQHSRAVFKSSREFIIIYRGEVSSGPVPGCPHYPPHEVRECSTDCICADSWNNTYMCIRQLGPMENTIRCLFRDNEDFMEVYNLTADPYQMQNLHLPSPNSKIQVMKFLKNYCKESACRQSETYFV